MLHASRLVPWQSTVPRFIAGSLCLKPRAVVRISSRHSPFVSNRASSCMVGRACSAGRVGGGGGASEGSRRGGRTVDRCSVNVVSTIASIDEQTNLNQKPLYDELQRYGVDEADYDFTANNTVSTSAVPPVDSKGSKDIAFRKRKATELEVKHPTLKEESGVIEDWCAYLLLSSDSHKTYVGVTYDIRRRLRQHNGEIAGGAKAARTGRPWSLVCTVRGFGTRSEACQFEWRWKAAAAKIKTVSRSETEVYESPLIIRRRAALDETLNSKEDWKGLQVQWHP
ncbi:hypothetical protein Mapa_000566 [Marchantia paleacea]|nr:hypothetical protein Mapa_000566 [Marchantia paleacea]